MEMLIRFFLTSVFLIVFIFNHVLNSPITSPNAIGLGRALGKKPGGKIIQKEVAGISSSEKGKDAKPKTKLMAVYVPDNNDPSVRPLSTLSHTQNGAETDTNAENYEKYHWEMSNPSASWPLGIIPYDFDTTSFDSILGERVREVMDFLESVSCVQFKALAGKVPVGHSWISITNPGRVRECSHKPLRKSYGEIVLILGLDCLKRRDILHSLLHAIGFSDEVTHPHRDQYVRILWDNIQPRYHDLFGVEARPDRMLVEYDPMSIMHFHDRAFSRNGQATIALLMPGLQIQPTDKLSQLDKMKLRLAFGHECNRRTVDDLLDTCKSVMSEPKPQEEASDQDVSNEEGDYADDADDADEDKD